MPSITQRCAPRDLRRLADEELMELVGGGDVRAFSVVFDRHASGAFSLAHRMCASRVSAPAAPGCGLQTTTASWSCAAAAGRCL